MDAALRVLSGDLFGICARLKSIDEGYFVAYNLRLSRFEIHNGNQRGGTLALVVPYDKLDERAYRLCLKTRVENKEKLMEQMEKDNAQLQKSKLDESVKNAARQAETLLGAV